MHNGRRQPSRGGTSRMTRECQVRICEGLGVQFPGPTRHEHACEMATRHRGSTSNSGGTWPTIGAAASCQRTKPLARLDNSGLVCGLPELDGREQRHERGMAIEAATGSTSSARPGLPGVLIAATIGNVLEWFDFLVYGFFAVTIAEVFFPLDDPTVSLLVTFGTFGLA